MSLQSTQETGGPIITKLTPIDHLMPRSYVIGFIACFKMSRRANPLEVYEHLKTGLEETIKEIPFLNGRVVPVAGAEGQYQVESERSNDSFPLIFNDMRSQSKNPSPHSYKTLAAANFSTSLLDLERLSPIAKYMQMERPPVIAVQANFFDGGALLYLSTIHTVCDVLAWHNVLQIWARRVRESWSEELSDSIIPVSPLALDRSSLMNGHPGVQRMDVREFRLQAKNANSPNPKDHLIDSPPSSATEMQLTIFTMSKAQFIGLRNSISETGPNGSYVTANNALAAFIWDRINHARFAENPNSNLLKGNLSIAADGRTRLDPPLPMSYMGNAALGFPIALPILPESLYSTALTIQETMEEFSDKHLRDTIGFLNSIEDMTKERLMYAKTLNPTLVISNLKDMPFYELDWGRSLNMAENWRLAGSLADCIPRAVPSPARRDGGTDILVWIEKKAMQRLIADKEWCNWVDFLCN